MTDEQTTSTPAEVDPVGEVGAAPPGRAPGAGTLAVLAFAWLLAMLSSARQALGGSPDADPLTVTRAALELPQVILASLIAGVTVGLVLANLVARYAPVALVRAAPRYGVGAAAGAVTGVTVATPILLQYGGLPSILVLSGAVATAATLGGLLSGVRYREVVAAGATGALGVFVVVLVERVFESSLRDLFGAGESAASVVAASGWVVLTASLAGGTVAGVLGYVYLRRRGQPGLRWPAYLLAGAMPGLLALLAEVVTRLGGAPLFRLVSAASADDHTVLSYFNAARFNRALIVVFVGALVAIILLGRTLRSSEPPLASEPPPASEPPLASEPPASEPPAEPPPASEPPASEPPGSSPGTVVEPPEPAPGGRDPG